jgi:hypothetical protein
MKDMQEHLEKLRKLIAECELIRDLATNKAKRELFDKMATRFKAAAVDLERAITNAKSA